MNVEFYKNHSVVDFIDEVSQVLQDSCESVVNNM